MPSEKILEQKKAVVEGLADDADKAFIRGYSFYPEDIELPVTERTSRNVF